MSLANRLRGRIDNCKQYLEHLKSTAFEGLPHCAVLFCFMGKFEFGVMRVTNFDREMG